MANKKQIILPWEFKNVDPANPFFPLPKDYPELSADGQRQARVAAVRKQDTPLDFVASWWIFRTMYLMTTEEGFWYHKFAPSPPFHYEMIHDIASYGRNLFAAPRGTAKSVVVGKELPLLMMLARPHFRQALCLATDKMIEERFSEISAQLEDNSLIIDDFGPQKPPRGKGIWNKHHLTTRLGSKLIGFSVTGRKRGARPDLFVMDDPEYDDNPNSDTAGLVNKEKFEQMLFSQVIPMLEKGSAAVWVGTYIGRSSFLSYAIEGDDSRFRYWNKKVFKAGDPTSSDPRRRQLLWASKWDEETLKVRKAEIGSAAFAREYMNEIDSDQEQVLNFDPRKNFYQIVQPDDVYIESPLHSQCMMVCNAANPEKGWAWERREVEVRQWLASLYILVTVDVADTVTQHSDFSCVMVSGFDSENTLWVLDMWMARAPRQQILNQIFRLGYKWRARTIGIESYGAQIDVYESCKTMLLERQMEGWEPRVVPVKYPKTGRTAKPERISTLEWRFPRGKIKLPINWQNEWPWNKLLAQIHDFTYDMAMLDYDDGIDTLAMNHYVVHGFGINAMPEAPVTTLAQKIAMGDTDILPGISRISGMNSEEFTEELLAAIVNRAYNMGVNGQSPGGRPYYEPVKSAYVGRERGVPHERVDHFQHMHRVGQSYVYRSPAPSVPESPEQFKKSQADGDGQ